MSFPADALGHHLYFDHPPERGYKRTARCTAEGCGWQAPAPGTGYARGRQLHTEAHAYLLTGVTT